MINYFQTIYSPIKIFSRRNLLQSWQMILIVILLNSLMLIPIARKVGKLQSIQLNDYLPGLSQVINDEFLQEVKQLSVNQGQLVINEMQRTQLADDAELIFLPDENILSDFSEEKTYVIFLPQEYIIKEKGKPNIQQPYVDPNRIVGAKNVETLKNEMTNQWFISNRPAIILVNIINIALLLFISQFLLIIGIAFFLSFMRLWQSCDIHNFKEALTITLYAMGMPTLIAMVGGLIILNPIEMISFQGLVFIGMLIWSYWVTHFNDDYARISKRGVISGRN